MRTIALVLLLACGKSAKAPHAGGQRAQANDSYCEDKALPHAYEWGSQDDAEAAGCKLRRVHRQIERDGKKLDDEVIVFCCP